MDFLTNIKLLVSFLYVYTECLRLSLLKDFEGFHVVNLFDNWYISITLLKGQLQKVRSFLVTSKSNQILETIDH